MTDPLITIAAVALDCLTTAVTGNPNPPGEMCYRVGTEPAHDLSQFVDLCCTGLGYVMLGDTFPAGAGFPSQDTQHQVSGVCGPPSWAQVFRMGIIRCIPVGDDQGNPPTCAEWNAAFLQNAYDAASLRQAACCLRQWFINSSDFFLGMSIVIDRQIQGNPSGGCVERFMTLTVQFPNCDC